MLWPTEIYSFKNEIIDNNKIKELILQKEDGSAGISGSRRPFGGAWQSNRSILEENNFSEIKDFLFECTSSIKNEIYDDDVKFSLVQSWANVNRYNHDNSGHIHDDTHWSCVYYVTETFKSPIYFVDPRVRAQMFAPYDLLNEKHKYYGNIGPEQGMPGDAFFFPSWLEHGVFANSTDNPRISISCNYSVLPEI